MKTTNLKAAPLVLALLGAGIIGGAAVEAVHHATPPAKAAVLAPMPAPTVTSPATGTSVVMPDFPLITQRYGPAVVNISVTGRSQAQAPDMSDPLEFFR